MSLPWALKMIEDYEAACSACERWVVVDTVALLRKVRGSLAYDKRKIGGRGRCLTVDIAELGLCKGDRLSPHPGMADTAQLDDAAPSPGLALLFWRPSCETSVRRRNPLFSAITGIVPEDVFVVDWLHACSLGVYKVFLSFLWHALFAANMFGLAPSTAEALFAVNVGRVRELLFTWYAEEAEKGRDHTRCQNLTPEMVAGDALGTWGAETNGLLLFSVSLMRRFGERLPAEQRRHLGRGLASLVGVHIIISTHKTGMLPTGVVQELADYWKEHLHAVRALGITFKPKHHSMAHVVGKVIKHGAPHLWANWVDEKENHELAQQALIAHRSVWGRRLLSTHRLAYGTRRRKK